MYAGAHRRAGAHAELFAGSAMPYTQALLAALPEARRAAAHAAPAIAGRAAGPDPPRARLRLRAALRPGRGAAAPRAAADGGGRRCVLFPRAGSPSPNPQSAGGEGIQLPAPGWGRGPTVRGMPLVDVREISSSNTRAGGKTVHAVSE